MTDLEALHAAVLAHPEEDTPRLAYADELEERGDPERAAYIRWHISGAMGGYAAGKPFSVSPSLEWVPSWPRHTRRERVDGIDYLDGDGLAATLTFGRGFGARLACHLGAFLSHAESMFRSHPITTVRITDQSPDSVRIHDGSVRWIFRRWPDADEAAGRPVPRGYLPRALWDTPYISADPVFGGSGKSPRVFMSAFDAMDELSAACVSLGRELAGLACRS